MSYLVQHSTSGGDIVSNSEKLPFFVYGTLMTGFGNNKRYLGNVVEKSDKAILANANLFDVSGGAYPGLVIGAGEVVGELITIKDSADYEEVLAGVDRLEGYHEGYQRSLYIRRRAIVTDSEGFRYSAWVYLWNRLVDGRFEVPNGDWRAYVLSNSEGDN
jgi:gamma-glutamylcyclotransferase (GGCT)/AIG2-like uncharacterized protein YtfP